MYFILLSFPAQNCRADDQSLIYLLKASTVSHSNCPGRGSHLGYKLNALINRLLCPHIDDDAIVVG